MIISNFQDQVRQRPDKIAIKDKECVITYEALDKQTNQIASLIQEVYNDSYQLSNEEQIRYKRQLLLDGWGLGGQERLKSATVFVAGAGGSGSPLIMQLALCGIGNIIVADFDEVELSNLNRQFLHDMSRIGMNKALSAKESIQKINPEVNIIPISEKITTENIFDIVGESEIIFDNVDDLETKFILSECAVKKGIPHIISSMIEINSYVAIFHSPYTPCFHCVYDKAKLKEIAHVRQYYAKARVKPNPVASPSLFLSTGFACNEAIKILLGFEDIGYNKYFYFNQTGKRNIANTDGYRIITYPFSNHFKRISSEQGYDWDLGWDGSYLNEINIRHDPQCPLCSTERTTDGDRVADRNRPIIRDIDLIDNESITGESNSVQPVAILLNHGFRVIKAILGVLKSGKVYVPIDSSYPNERIEYMMEHSGARVIITDTENLAKAKMVRCKINTALPIINLDEIDGSVPSSEIGIRAQDKQPAYILYTSGSTGKPKGVLQTHENVLYFIKQYKNNLEITENDHLAWFASLGHDASVMDIFSGLLSGATLHPFDLRKNEMSAIAGWLKEEGITVWHSVPTVFRYFANTLNDKDNFDSLRLLVMGGEPISTNELGLFRRYFPLAQLYNLYGQTESSYNSGEFFYADEETNQITIGKANEGFEIIIVNEEGTEMDYLQTGEILIVGKNIALGYWKDEKSTELIFSKDDRGNSIYWTGDLGRKLLDGKIEFLGRKDQQIKIRGNRVELSEIEFVMSQVYGMKQCVVISYQEDNENLLAGLYTSHTNIDENMLLMNLRRSLPEYMIPNILKRVEDFPLTTSGKIDRKAISRDFVSNFQNKTEYIAARSVTEQKLVKIWHDILKVERIGINDNFFVLGGHSIKATILMSAIQRELNISVPLIEIFNKPTVYELADFIGESTENIMYGIQKAAEKEYYALSYNQKRLWIIQTLAPKSNAYNLTKRVFLYHAIDVLLYEKALLYLIQRHESFRTGFKQVGNEVYQYILDKVETPLQIIDLTSYEEEKRYEELDRMTEEVLTTPFDLMNPPLFRFVLFRINSKEYCWTCCIHHIIADGWSLEILRKEMPEILNAFDEGREPILSSIEVQYKDYAEWQNNLVNDSKYKTNALSFWKERIDGGFPKLNLAVDFNKVEEFNEEGAGYSYFLDENIKERAKSFAKDNKTTLSAFLFTAYNILLSQFTGQDEVVTVIIGSGRDQASIENTIGYFITPLVVKVQIGEDKLFGDLLENISQQLIDVLRYQQYPLELICEEYNTEFPKVRAAYNMRNMQETSGRIRLSSHEAYHSENGKGVKYDLVLYITEYKNSICLYWNYKRAFFKGETIEALNGGFVNLLLQIL